MYAKLKRDQLNRLLIIYFCDNMQECDTLFYELNVSHIVCGRVSGPCVNYTYMACKGWRRVWFFIHWIHNRISCWNGGIKWRNDGLGDKLCPLGTVWSDHGTLWVIDIIHEIDILGKWNGRECRVYASTASYLKCWFLKWIICTYSFKE